MNTTEHVLLIILASALALLLVLAITAVAMIIGLLKSLRHVAETADNVLQSAESVATILRRAATPVTMMSFVRGVAEAVVQHKQDRKEKK